MKKWLVTIIFFISSVLYSQIILKTDLPKIINSKIYCSVAIDSVTKYYFYNYTLKNGVGNTGNICSFDIDVSRAPNTIDIDTVGLQFFRKFNRYIEKTNRRGYQIFGGRFTPVGFPILPNEYWIATINGNYSKALFYADTLFLEPGKVLGDFVMMSKGLPGIRKYTIEPEFYIDEYVLSEEEDTVENAQLSKINRGNIDSVQNSLFVHSLIVGPISPPINFVSTVWLDTLSSYTTQSRTLGWITTQPIANKYLNYFATAKTQLQSNNTGGARTTLQQVLTDVNIDSSSTLTSEAYALLRFNTEYLLSKLPVPTTPYLTIALKNSSGTKLSGGTLQYYDASWKDAVNNNDGTFNINTTKPSLSLRMTYAYGSQQKSNVAVNSDTVIFQTVNAQVQLRNSNGTLLDTGTVRYYAGAWRSFGTTSNGIATKELLAGSYSFRMTYGYASIDTVQDLNANPTVVFKTTNAQVQLKNSQGDMLDQGTVQYYSGAWRTFGTTSNGVASKELLPTIYSFRITYAYGSNDKAQNIKTDPVVLFQTTNAQVQLKNSLGDLIDQGTVQYYSGAWRTFGTTTNGIATKELLPNNYSFRMTYAYASNDKAQNLNTDAIVIFQTVNAAVQLKNSDGNLIDQGSVQYYSGAWRTFGTTSNGVTTKELLPNSYQFRMTHEYVSTDKTQNVGSDNTVTFSTVSATVQVKNSQNNSVNNATVTYYSGAWRSFGTTVNGQAIKELLPVNLQFRAKLGTAQADKTQNLSTNSLVEIQLP